MRAACDATWRRVSIPWSAGERLTTDSVGCLGNVCTIELRDDAVKRSGDATKGWPCVDFGRALAHFRVLEHLPALRPGGQRSLVVSFSPSVRYFHDRCARVLTWRELCCMSAVCAASFKRSAQRGMMRRWCACTHT